MPSNLKVLFLAVEGTGHMNACISLAQQLRRAGHRVVFAATPIWEKKLKDYGFEVEGYVNEMFLDKEDPTKLNLKPLLEQKMFSDVLPLERLKTGTNEMIMIYDMTIILSEAFGAVIESVKPDVIVADQFMTLPPIEKSGIPWVWVWSANPIYMYGDDDDIPTFRLGLSTLDKSDWVEGRKVARKADVELCDRYNDYVVSKGVKPLKRYQFTNGSPYLNVYGFPEELDYSDLKPLPKHYIRFDNLMRSEKQKDFEIPIELKDRPGKLIYFSLGSMGGVDVELMKRLIGFMSKSEHRFIVSKGPRHQEIELADNMWGKETLPQLSILPVVDLVITHGGNNTLTETFFFGKPMIVMPLFGDQPDNAQRMQDKGFGIRLDPYRCSEQELLESIEKLLNDKELNEKMKNISKRIQQRNSIEEFPKIVEDLVKNN